MTKLREAKLKYKMGRKHSECGGKPILNEFFTIRYVCTIVDGLNKIYSD